MLKIEGHYNLEETTKYGWYIDSEGDPWYWDDNEPMLWLSSDGTPCLDTTVLNNHSKYVFTRLTGRIIISND